jgi:hypothetical protein
MKQEVWIGLVGVGPVEGTDVLGSAAGAFVNALAPASCPLEYEEAVTMALKEMDLFIKEVDKVEQFSTRAARLVLDRELHDLAEEVEESGEARFGDFYAYPREDA